MVGLKKEEKLKIILNQNSNANLSYTAITLVLFLAQIEVLTSLLYFKGLGDIGIRLAGIISFVLVFGIVISIYSSNKKYTTAIDIMKSLKLDKGTKHEFTGMSSKYMKHVPKILGSLMIAISIIVFILILIILMQ